MSGLRVLEVYGGGMGGGAARHLQELLPALADLGLEVQLASLGRDTLAPDGIARHSPSGLGDLLSLIRRLNPHVVHTHGVRANLVGRVAAHLAGCACVTTVHSFLQFDYRSRERAALAEFLDDATLPWADRLIAISSALRDYLIDRGARPEHVVVVPNGIPAPPPGDPGPLRAISAGGPVLAIAARLHPAKGVDLAIRALGLLDPDVRLGVFGEGPEESALRALAASTGVSHQVHFFGRREDLRALWTGADLALVPSRAEGFGLAALEAMAQGVPVVASRVGGLPELLAAGGGLLVPPDSVPALADGIRRALRDRGALSQSAREVAAHYSLDRCARSTAAVLESVRRD